MTGNEIIAIQGLGAIHMWEHGNAMSLPRWGERQNRDIFRPTEKRYISTGLSLVALC
ncbi:MULTISPECIES: hypothetical protein [Cyanophyceae]|uniref:hypothetical protein n=1 Tax=Cyanophyceae TaxID=3028117 RepID=UPI001685F6A0|nr:hypothetical protein [Trichocoleus sp. FACHB-40]MBD2003021.1 hypothetical protein [Trichocoleus sp. FACHB-40]